MCNQFLGQGFQKLEHKQDRHMHTDATEHITIAAFVGGDDDVMLVSQRQPSGQYYNKSIFSGFRSPSRNRIWCIFALKAYIWLQQISRFSRESNDQISCKIPQFYAEFGNT